jgi:hypothetical protein
VGEDAPDHWRLENGGDDPKQPAIRKMPDCRLSRAAGYGRDFEFAAEPEAVLRGDRLG